ncbi:hypothetical protein PAGU2595_029490 [Lysobacter xanthus]
MLGAPGKHMETARISNATWVDLALSAVLGGLLVAQLVVGLPTGEGWGVSRANALLGTNVAAWGVAFALAYFVPGSALLLSGLAWLSESFSRVGPFRVGPAWTLAWAVFFLFCGGLMLATGAGWL